MMSIEKFQGTWLMIFNRMKGWQETLNNQFSIFFTDRASITKVNSGKKHSEKVSNAGMKQRWSRLPREVCRACFTRAKNKLCPRNNTTRADPGPGHEVSYMPPLPLVVHIKVPNRLKFFLTAQD